MIKEKLNNKFLYFFLRAVFAVIFIFAGMEKISDPASFSQTIENYKLFPEFALNFIAIYLPWLEVISGILLVWSKHETENLLILNSLLVLFTIIIIISVLRGLNIECGCFGTAMGIKVGIAKIIENLVLILVGVYLQYFSQLRKNEI